MKALIDRLYNTLSFRRQLALALTFGLFSLALSTALVNAWQGNQRLRHNLLEQGYSLTETFARQSALALLYGSPENAREAVSAALGYPGVKHVRIMGADGKVLIARGEPGRNLTPLSFPQFSRSPALLSETDEDWTYGASVYSGDERAQDSPFALQPAVPQQLGYVLVVVSKHALTSMTRDMFQANLSIALSFAALFLLFGRLICNRLTKPLSQLAGIMAQAETAQQGLRADLRGPRDVGEMAAAFNKMMGVLERREAELRTARDSALETARVKADFAALVSHEVRTPLGAMLGTLETLKTTPLSATQGRQVDLLAQSAHALTELMSDMLDLSKMEAGKLDLQAAPFAVRRLIADLMHLFAGPAGQKHIDLDWQVDPDVPRALNGDAKRLRQVLTNLLSNAVKFTSGGRVNVSARVMERGAERAVLRFDVLDTGIGIEPEARAHVFQSFEQANPSISSRYGGTGLGLAICKRLVELMGGEIGLDDPVQGSAFWFTVPLGIARDETLDDQNEWEAREAEPSAAASALCVPPDVPASCRSHRPAEVLVVDDDRTMRVALRHAMEREDFLVQEAADGAAALEILHDMAPDLVLMDALMPRVDGFTACEEIARLRPGTPVLMLTGLDDAPSIERAFAAGAIDYIPKPVNFKALSQRVRRIIEGGRAERKLLQSEEMLRRLSAHLQSVREEERKHVAREIHDVLGATLTVIKMELVLLARRLPQEAQTLRDKAQDLIAMSDQAISTVRKLCSELRPSILDNFGLVAAIEWLAQEYSERFNIPCTLHSDSGDISLDPEVATALFRIVQEALTNITRHADASEIRIEVTETEDRLAIEVRDNGRGISEEEIANTASLGLLGMFERARLFGGRVEISGAPEHGTRVTAIFPQHPVAVTA